MKSYKWRGRSRNGKIIRGRLSAENTAAVAHYVQNKYGYVTKITPVADSLWGVTWKKRRKLNLGDKEQLFRQVGGLLDSGITIIRALELLGNKNNVSLADITLDLSHDLTKGVSFSNAIRKHPQNFSPLVVQLIAAGELSGNLPYIMFQLADYYREERELKAGIINACLYPSIVLVVALLTGGYFFMRVLPIFIELYSVLQLGQSKFLHYIFTVAILSAEYKTIVFSAGVLIMFLLYILRKRLWNYCLRLPRIKNMHHSLWETRYCRILALLLESGITMAQGLKLLESILPQYSFGKQGASLTRAVIGGMSLSKAATLHSGLFSTTSVEFIALGEANGSLTKMLRQAAKVLDDNLRETSQRIKIFLEPLLLFFLTTLIGGIFYCLMTPVYGMVTQLSNYN